MDADADLHYSAGLARNESWATWPPTEILELGRLGRIRPREGFVTFDRNYRAPDDIARDMAGVSTREPAPPVSVDRGSGKDWVWRVNGNAGMNATQAVGDVSVRLTLQATTEHAAILRVAEAVEVEPDDPGLDALMARTLDLIIDHPTKFQIDTCVVTKTWRCTTEGFSAYAGSAGRAFTLEGRGAAGPLVLTQGIPPGDARLRLARTSSIHDDDTWTFAEGHTPVFQCHRIDARFWPKLLNQRAKWKIVNAQLRGAQPRDRNDLPSRDDLKGSKYKEAESEQLRYDAEHAELAPIEVRAVPIRELFRPLDPLAVNPVLLPDPSTWRSGGIPWAKIATGLVVSAGVLGAVIKAGRIEGPAVGGSTEPHED